MRSPTKRLMELTVVLAFALCAYGHWEDYPWWGKHGNDRAIYPSYNKTMKSIHQAIWDKYGPGTKEEYIRIFDINFDQGPSRFPQFANLKSGPSWFQTAYHVSQHIGDTLAFTAVPEAPDWFQDDLNRAAIAADLLHQTLEKGPMIPAPDERDFRLGTDTTINYFNIQNGVRTLRQLALRDWMAAEWDRAIERLNDILRLGDAFEHSTNLIDHLMRASIINTGLSGFQTIIWNDPEPEMNRKIYEMLERLESWNWTFPPYLENILFRDFNAFDKNMSPDRWCTFMLLINTSNPECEPDLTKTLCRMGVIPRNERTISRALALLDQWTALPAMRKRLAGLPDSFFESDDLFSIEDAKQIPRILYVASKVQMKTKNYYPDLRKRLDVAQAEALTLAGAYWVRCWHDEHGTWPTENDFDASPYGETLDLAITELPEVVLNHFAAMYPVVNPYQGIARPSSVIREKGEILYPFNVPPENSPEFKKYHPDTSRAGLIDWTKGMFTAMQPWVESVTPIIISEATTGITHFYPLPEFVRSQSRDYFTIKLHLPKKTYWVKHSNINSWPGMMNNKMMINQEIVIDQETLERLIHSDRLAGWE